jgi:hypothetical protein
VEIEDVPVGTCEPLVDGEHVADIVVSAATAGIKGEVESSREDEPAELLLTFDRAGKTLTVRQGATVFFSRSFPAE